MIVSKGVDRIVAACNTGPLLSAFQCSGSDFIKRYCARIYITPSQLGEFKKHGAAEEIQALMDEGLVRVASELSKAERRQAEALAGQIAKHPASGDLDPASHLPEAEMIVIALRPKLDCRLVLLDERAARTIAEEQGLRVTGFPGILARAGRDGLLSKSDIRQMLKLCQQQGTHYSNALIEHVAETYGG